MNMCICMFISLFLWFTYAQLEKGLACTIVAVTLHFFWLATFFWMNINGFDMWRTFRSSSPILDRESLASLYIWYNIYAWVLPLIITTTGLVLSYTLPELGFAYGGDRLCWLHHPTQVFMTFLCPIGLVCLSNFLFFVDTIVNIVRARDQSSVATEAHRTAKDFLPYVKVPIVLGFSWLLAFLGSVFDVKTLIIVPDLVNSSQGIILLAIFISNRRIRALYGWVKDGDPLKSTKTMSHG